MHRTMDYDSIARRGDARFRRGHRDGRVGLCMVKALGRLSHFYFEGSPAANARPAARARSWLYRVVHPHRARTLAARRPGSAEPGRTSPTISWAARSVIWATRRRRARFRQRIHDRIENKKCLVAFRTCESEPAELPHPENGRPCRPDPRFRRQVKSTLSRCGVEITLTLLGTAQAGHAKRRQPSGEGSTICRAVAGPTFPLLLPQEAFHRRQLPDVLVEIDAPAADLACATPVTNGMKVWTHLETRRIRPMR